MWNWLRSSRKTIQSAPSPIQLSGIGGAVLQVGAIDYLNSLDCPEVAVGFAARENRSREMDFLLMPLLNTLRLNENNDPRIIENISRILNRDEKSVFSAYLETLISRDGLKDGWANMLDEYLLANGSQISEYIKKRAGEVNATSSLRERVITRALEFENSEEVIRYSTERISDGERKFVGGLADRLKGAATAFMIALGTQRRFEIEWIHPHSLNELYKPVDYDWIPREEWGEERVIDIVDGRFKPEVRENVRTSSINEWLSVRHPNTRVHCNLFEKNLLANPSTGIGPSSEEWVQEEIFGVFLSLFEYRPNLEESAILSLFISHLDVYDLTIAMHFRTGGDGDWKDPVMDDRANVEKLISKCRELSAGKNSCVLFATDSLKLKEDIMSKYSDELSMFCIEIPIAHVDRSTGDEAIRGSRLAVMENHMITLCNHILAGKGAFSVLAANRRYEMPWRYFRDR